MRACFMFILSLGSNGFDPNEHSFDLWKRCISIRSDRSWLFREAIWLGTQALVKKEYFGAWAKRFRCPPGEFLSIRLEGDLVQ